MADLDVDYSSSASESAPVSSAKKCTTATYSGIPASTSNELIEPHGCDDLSSDEKEFLKVLSVASGEHFTQVDNGCDEKHISATLPLVNGSCSVSSRDLSIPIKPFDLHAGEDDYAQPSTNPPTSLGSHWIHNYVITFPETSPLVAEKLFASHESHSLDSAVTPAADDPSNGDCSVPSISGFGPISIYPTEPRNRADGIITPPDEVSSFAKDPLFFASKTQPSVGQSTSSNVTCSAKCTPDLGKGSAVGEKSATHDSRLVVSPIASMISEESNTDFQDLSKVSFSFNLPLFAPPPNGLAKSSSVKSGDACANFEAVDNSCVSDCEKESPAGIVLPPAEVEKLPQPGDDQELNEPIVPNSSTTLCDSQEPVLGGSLFPTDLTPHAKSLELEKGPSSNTSERSSSLVPGSALSSHWESDILLPGDVSQNFSDSIESPRETEQILHTEVNSEPIDDCSNFKEIASPFELTDKTFPILVHPDDSASDCYYRKEEHSPVSDCAETLNLEWKESAIPCMGDPADLFGVPGTAEESVQVPQTEENDNIFGLAHEENLAQPCIYDTEKDISSPFDANRSSTPVSAEEILFSSSELIGSNICTLASSAELLEEVGSLVSVQNSCALPNEPKTKNIVPDDSKSPEQPVIDSPTVEPRLTSPTKDTNYQSPAPKPDLQDADAATLPLSSLTSPVPTSSLLVQQVLALSIGDPLPCEGYSEVNTLQNSYFDGDPSTCVDFSSDCIVDNFSTDQFGGFDEHSDRPKSEALNLGGENLESASAVPDQVESEGTLFRASELSEKLEDCHQELGKLPSPTLQDSNNSKTFTETLEHEHDSDTVEIKTNLEDAALTSQQNQTQKQTLDSDVDLKIIHNIMSDNLKRDSETRVTVPAASVSSATEETKDKKPAKGKKVIKKKIAKVLSDATDVPVGGEAVTDKAEIEKDTQKLPPKGKKKGKKNKFDCKDDTSSPPKKEEPLVVERRRLIRGQKWRQDVSKLRDNKEPLPSLQVSFLNVSSPHSEADLEEEGGTNLPVGVKIDREESVSCKISDDCVPGNHSEKQVCANTGDAIASKGNFESGTATARKISEPSSTDDPQDVSNGLEDNRDTLPPQKYNEIAELKSYTAAADRKSDTIPTDESHGNDLEILHTDKIDIVRKEIEKDREIGSDCITPTDDGGNSFGKTINCEEKSPLHHAGTLVESRKIVTKSDEQPTYLENIKVIEKTQSLDPMTSIFSVQHDVSNTTLDTSNYELSTENSKEDNNLRTASDELVAESIDDCHSSDPASTIIKSSDQHLPSDSISIGFHPLNKTQTRIVISRSQSPLKDSRSSDDETKKEETVPVYGAAKDKSSENFDFPVVVRVSETAEREQAETEYLSSTSDSSNSQAGAQVCADGRVPSSDSWQTDDSDADIQDFEVLRTGDSGGLQNVAPVQTSYSFSVPKGSVDLDNTKDSIDSNEEYAHYVFESGGMYLSSKQSEPVLDSTDENVVEIDDLSNVGMAGDHVPEKVIASHSIENLPTISGMFGMSYIEPTYRVSVPDNDTKLTYGLPINLDETPASEKNNLGDILYDDVCQCISSSRRQEPSTDSGKKIENVCSDDELVMPSLFDVETTASQGKGSLQDQLTPPESPLPGNSPRPTSAASSGGQGSDECSYTASREASESPIRGSSPVTKISACLPETIETLSMNASHSPGFITKDSNGGTSSISPAISGPGTSKSPLSLPSVRKMSRKKINSKKIQQRLERRDTDMIRMSPLVMSSEKQMSSISKTNRSPNSLDRMSDSEEDVTEATDTTLKETNKPCSNGIESPSFSSEPLPGEVLIPYDQTNLNKRASDSEEDRPNNNGLIQRWEAVQRQALNRQQQSRQLHALHSTIKQLHLNLDALQQHYTASEGKQQAEGNATATDVADGEGEDGAQETEEASTSTAEQKRAPAADAHSLQQLQDRLAIAQAREDRLSEIQAELSQLSLRIHHHSTDSGHQLPQLQHQLHHLYQQSDHLSHCISSELSRLTAACSALEAWQRQAEELRNCLQQDDATLSRLQEAVSGGPAALSRLQLEEGPTGVAGRSGDSLSGTARGLANILAQGQASNGSASGGVRSFGGSSSRLSDSGTSGYESCSSDDLSERERRLHALKRLAAELEGTLHPHSLAWTNIKKTISVAENELSSLQKRCRELLLQTAERVAPSTTTTLCTRASRRRAAGNQSRISRTGRHSPSRSGRSNAKVAAPRNGWLWRVVRFALPIQAALLLLFCVSCLLEPSCCDNVNTFNMELGPQVRFIHGLPPV